LSTFWANPTQQFVAQPTLLRPARSQFHVSHRELLIVLRKLDDEELVPVDNNESIRTAPDDESALRRSPRSTWFTRIF
jgi:hypothetical protein